MRTITPTELTFTVAAIAGVDAPSSSDMAMSALQMTREAIARWTGSTTVAAARDLQRVSPQARWLAQAQQDLAAWIDAGGFAQIGSAAAPELLPPLPGPVMYNIPAGALGTSAIGTTTHDAGACVE